MPLTTVLKPYETIISHYLLHVHTPCDTRAIPHIALNDSALNCASPGQMGRHTAIRPCAADPVLFPAFKF